MNSNLLSKYITFLNLIQESESYACYIFSEERWPRFASQISGQFASHMYLLKSSKQNRWPLQENSLQKNVAFQLLPQLESGLESGNHLGASYLSGLRPVPEAQATGLYLPRFASGCCWDKANWIGDLTPIWPQRCSREDNRCCPCSPLPLLALISLSHPPPWGKMWWFLRALVLNQLLAQTWVHQPREGRMI